MLITPTQISRQLCLLIYLQLLEIIAINAPLPSAIIFAIPLLPHKKAKSGAQELHHSDHPGEQSGTSKAAAADVRQHSHCHILHFSKFLQLFS